MDGLSSVVGLSAAVIMAIIATTDGHVEVAAVAIVLAGSLAGFLAYNLPPASIYLGDSGSMVIGLVAGIISMQGGLKTTATLSLTVPAVVMCVPMLDTALAIVRRKLTGQRFDTADRGHIHHKLLDRGLSTWQALCVIGSLCLATGAAATAASILRVESLAWVTALGVFMLLVRTRAFGHYEYALVSRFLAVRVADVIGLLAALFGANGQKRLEALAALPFAEAWSALTDEMASCRAHRLELSMTRQRECHAAHAWTCVEGGLPMRSKTLAGRTSANDAWSLSLRFAGPDGELCQLCMVGHPMTAVGFNRLARAARILSVFGSHWAKHAEQVPPGQAVTADAMVVDPTLAARMAA
jgi:UDP-GlcNAc:undecaprenyl-phosphate GlcNAc-1-phosphate transferase